MTQAVITRIKLLNSILFFAIWTTLLFLNAAQPLQFEFYALVALILVLTILLYLYLQDFLIEMQQHSSGLFRRNLFTFTFIGVSLGLLTAVILINIGPTLNPFDISVWVGFTFFMSLVNGILLYGFNQAILAILHRRQR